MMRGSCREAGRCSYETGLPREVPPLWNHEAEAPVGGATYLQHCPPTGSRAVLELNSARLESRDKNIDN